MAAINDLIKQIKDDNLRQQIEAELRKVMKQMLETMKDIRLVEPVVTIKSRMKEQDKAQLETLVNQIINS